MRVSALLLGVVAWHATDPTFWPYSKSDSPEGKYRCVIFHDSPHFRFALFEKGWRWHELPGERGELYTDSLDLSDIQYTWTGDHVTVTGSTGRDLTKTATARVVNGRQVWK